GTACPEEPCILSKKPDGDKRILVSSASSIRTLDLFYDHGIIRVEVRLRDSGNNFKRTEADVKEYFRKWDQDNSESKLLERECDWVFSLPKASRRGGIWESLIRSIRRVLRALLRDRPVDDETLQTTLAEIEKTLNDRPLVKLTSDPNDYAVTPNHLLHLSANPSTASHCTDSRNLTKTWRHANHLAELFRNRCMKEYLPTLHTTSRWIKQGRSLNEGDLVLWGDIFIPRRQCEKVIVERAVQSTDGSVREAIGTAFPDEPCILSKKPDGVKRTLVSSASSVRNLDLFYDHGIIRVEV
ncbi:hypothetical protein X801_06392, partial [Opisthorchis viverrini]